MTDKTFAPLSLHVPEPEWRPGDVPDFSGVNIPRAGTVRRPEVDEDPENMRDLAFTIIRVLNRDGEAVGPWAGLLSDEELKEGLRHMMLLRTFDARMLTAQRQGKTSFYMQHLGEEAISSAFRRALEPGDMNFPTYRQAGLLIASDYPLVKMMNQIFPMMRIRLRGRQLPIMYSSKEHGFFSISGNLGTQFVAGRRLGDGVGDLGRHTDRGGLDRRRARRRKMISMPRWCSPPPTRRRWCSISSTISGRSRRSRASRRGVRARSRRAGMALAFRRSGSMGTTISPSMRWRNGPSNARGAISGRRWSNMSPIAPAATRRPTIPPPTGPKEEGDAWPLGDPVLRLKTHLIQQGTWSEERHVQAEAQVMDEVIAAQKEAEAIGTLRSGPRAVAARYVRGCLCGHAAAPHSAAPGSGVLSMARMTMIEAIRNAHDVAMGRDERVVVFRRGCRLFRGVFRCTAGLQKKYGQPAAASIRRSAKAGSSAPRSGWRRMACGRASRSSSPTTCIPHTTRSCRRLRASAIAQPVTSRARS